MNERRNKSFKPALSKNALVFFLSLMLAAVGVYFSKLYIESKVGYYRKQFSKAEPMTEVVVPKRKLQRGETINASLLAVRDMPVRYADSNAITGSSYETAIGQKLGFDVDEGRPLLWAHLEGGLSPTFSGKVPSGSRAMTVRVDEINSISGFLQPGDRIDFLLTHKLAGEEQIFPLIQNLPVIATGLETLVNKTSQSAGRAFNTITVRVTPEEAKKLGLSQQVGRLTAMLRNPEDELSLGLAPLSVAQLLNEPPKPALPAKPVQKRKRRVIQPRIEYIIGGS